MTPNPITHILEQGKSFASASSNEKYDLSKLDDLIKIEEELQTALDTKLPFGNPFGLSAARGKAAFHFSRADPKIEQAIILRPHDVTKEVPDQHRTYLADLKSFRQRMGRLYGHRQSTLF